MAEHGRTPDLLARLRFVNPHRAPGRRPAWTYRPVPASGSAPAAGRRPGSTSRSRSSGPAGRWRLPEFHARPPRRHCWCWCDGELVHEWYADGLRSGAISFLGASATKSLLAHLVGVRGPGPVHWTWTTRSRRTCPSWPAPATRAVPVRRAAHHDQRRRLGGGPPRPGRSGQRAASGRSPGAASSRALLARGRRPLPAGHPLRVLHGRLAGARLGARTGHRRALPRRRSPQLWAAMGCVADAAVAVDGEGVALAGGGVAAAAGGLGPDRRAAGRRHRVGRTATRPAGPRLGRRRLPPVAAVPAPGPAAQRAVHARRVRLPLVAAGRRRRTGSAPTAAAASSSTSTAPSGWSW